MENGRVNPIAVTKQSNRRNHAKRWMLALAAMACMGLGVSSTRAQTFFDWLQDSTSGANAGNQAGTSPYQVTPTLSAQTTGDPNYAAVVSQLNYDAAHSLPLSVKIRGDNAPSDAVITALYNAYNITYTFADYEGIGADTSSGHLVSLIKASTGTGPSYNANSAYVGNFAMATIPNDPTHPNNNVYYTSGNSNTEPYFTSTQFANAGLNMSSESLYPGDASFRNPVFGSTTTGMGSTAPNIRSALFTLPIIRLGLATQNIGAGYQHIPFISRFDNSDNPAFSNGTSNGQAAFIAGSQSTNPSNPGYSAPIGGLSTADQLLSRDDFEAQVLHYRMRGATGYYLLVPGVVGYTEAQEQADAQSGWNGDATTGNNASSLVNSVFAGPNARPATLPTLITVNGTLMTMEQAGVIWSGVTNDNATGVGLEILVSNMSGQNDQVGFNTTINGAKLIYTTGSLTGGTHTLLQFTKSGGTWMLTTSSPIFNDPSLASREGTGIPEPASLALLGLGTMGVLARRRRKA